MYQLSIGLGYSVFQLLIKPLDFTYIDIIKSLSQQKIVLSDHIVDYYKMKAGDFSELVDAFISANAVYDNFEYYITDSSKPEKIETEFVSLVSQNPLKLMMVEEEEFPKKALSQLRTSTINDYYTKQHHPLKMYSLPVTNFCVKEGDDKNIYLQWFKRLMKGETVIRIIDQYLITDKGINIFNDCYLPLIDPKARIELYGTDSHINNGWTPEELNKKINRHNHDVHMFIISRNEYHDRFIWAGNIVINIGKGLDFIDNKHPTIQQQTTISVSNGVFVQPRIIGDEVSY